MDGYSVRPNDLISAADLLRGLRRDLDTAPQPQTIVAALDLRNARLIDAVDALAESCQHALAILANDTTTAADALTIVATDYVAVDRAVAESYRSVANGQT